MNKKLINIIVFIACTFCVYGQGTFNNYYDSEVSDGNFFAEIFNLTDGISLLSTNPKININGNIFSNPEFSIIDINGNTTSSILIENDSMSLRNQADQQRNILIQDTLIAIVSITWNENLSLNSFPYYLLYDLKNDSLLQLKYYNDPEWAQLYAGMYHTDGYIYAVGEQYPEDLPNRDALMMKIDLEGNIIHRKTVHRGSFDLLYGIESITDSTLLLFGGNRGVNSDNYDGWILETDLDFEIISEQLIGTPTTDGALLINKNDDRFVAYHYRNEEWSDFYLFQMNYDLEIIWDSLYNNTIEIAFKDFLVEEDGIVFTGDILDGLLEDDNIWNQKSIAQKRDFNGDLIWERVYYRINEDQHRLRSVIQKDNGGYIFGGEVQIAGTVDVVSWVFTTDSIGCLDVSSYDCLDGLDSYIQVWTDIPPEQAYYENQISISPNPASNLIQINTDIDLRKIEAAQIVNLKGQLVQTLHPTNISQPINVQGIASGLYLLQLQVGEEVLVERFYKD